MNLINLKIERGLPTWLTPSIMNMYKISENFPKKNLNYRVQKQSAARRVDRVYSRRVQALHEYIFKKDNFINDKLIKFL